MLQDLDCKEAPVSVQCPRSCQKRLFTTMTFPGKRHYNCSMESGKLCSTFSLIDGRTISALSI